MKKRPFDAKVPLDDPKQELFCVIFTSNTLPKFWGNGQNSYEFAYGYTDKIDAVEDEIRELNKILLLPKKKRKKTIAQIVREVEDKNEQIRKMHQTCRSASSRLLTNVHIKERNGHFLDTLSVNLIVDRELTYLIQQREDNGAKMNAIEHYNKREQRIREKIEIKHDFEPIKTIRMTTPPKK